MDKLKKLQEMSVPAGKSWIKEARERQKNRKWLNHSGDIALRVLRVLRAKGITQVELAERMGVSAQQVNKIVKGSENLSLETIAKLETALEISLFALPDFTHKESYASTATSTVEKPQKVYRKTVCEQPAYVYSKTTITSRKSFSTF